MGVMKRRRLDAAAHGPLDEANLPPGFVIAKHDENGLMLHWSDWRLVPSSTSPNECPTAPRAT
jgi:hypothetical protein